MVHRIVRAVIVGGCAIFLGPGSNASVGWADEPTGPTVVLQEPEEGAVLSGDAVLSAEVTGSFTIASVVFVRDNLIILGAGTKQQDGSLYELTIDTTTIPNGSHRMYALAWTQETRRVCRYPFGPPPAPPLCFEVPFFGESAQHQVTVDNGIDITPPDVTLRQPTSGAVIAGDVLVKADATDDMSVAEVSFYVDGSNTAFAVDLEAPYEVSWNTRTVANGAHTIRAIAADAASNTDMDDVTITVVNGPAPFVAIMSPQDKGTVKAGRLVTIEAAAASIEGIAHVAFFVNGNRKCVDHQPNNGLYTCSWRVPQGTRTYTLKAKATDRRGGSAVTSIKVNGKP